MTQPQDGGPAFPFVATDQSNVAMQSQGMSLRDWFAGQVLGQSMANLTDEFGDWSYVAVARCAYAQADAMIAEGNKP